MKKSKKRPTRRDLDKMSFEKRERIRKKLREGAAYTRSFRTRQSFGAAGPVRRVPIEEYMKEMKEKENGN